MPCRCERRAVGHVSSDFHAVLTSTVASFLSFTPAQEAQRAAKAARLAAQGNAKPGLLTVEAPKPKGNVSAAAAVPIPSKPPSGDAGTAVGATPSSLSNSMIGSYMASVSPKMGTNTSGGAAAAAAAPAKKEKGKGPSVVPMQMQMDTSHGRAKMQKNQVIARTGVLRIVPLFSHLPQYERNQSITADIKQKKRTLTLRDCDRTLRADQNPSSCASR